MNIDIVTKDDLERFKKELLEEIRSFIIYSQKAGEASKTWLKSFEVRKLLGISAGMLQNLRVNGTLPFTKIGGLMYYKYEDILKLMDGKNNSRR